MICCLIARDNLVLVEHTFTAGNHIQVAHESVLPKINYEKKFSHFSLKKYDFYCTVQGNLLFLVLVKDQYEMETAFTFLKELRTIFSQRFSNSNDMPNNQTSFPFHDFKPIMIQCMKKYKNKHNIDQYSILLKRLDAIQKMLGQIIGKDNYDAFNRPAQKDKSQ